MPLRVIVDTREQQPLSHSNWKVKQRKLEVGDYSLVNQERYVTVERKGLNDFFHSFTGSRRNKMFRKLERMGDMQSLLLVEAPIDEVLRGNGYSNVSPTRLVGSVLYQCARHGVAAVFCERYEAPDIVDAFFTAYLDGG